MFGTTAACLLLLSKAVDFRSIPHHPQLQKLSSRVHLLAPTAALLLFPCLLVFSSYLLWADKRFNCESSCHLGCACHLADQTNSIKLLTQTRSIALACACQVAGILFQMTVTSTSRHWPAHHSEQFNNNGIMLLFIKNPKRKLGACCSVGHPFAVVQCLRCCALSHFPKHLCPAHTCAEQPPGLASH